MSQRSDDPLRKCTLNLYEADCQWFEREYGHGWTERLRQHIHEQVIRRQLNKMEHSPYRRTLGDLDVQ